MIPPEFSMPNVSRETFLDLDSYARLLTEANTVVNLISRKDIQNLWERHIHDSLLGYQVLEKVLGQDALSQIKTGLDIGSGGGLPGVVMSLCMPHCHMTFAESVGKKCAFLQKVIVQLSLNAHVHHGRVEDLKGRFSLIMSRAVAKLDTLFDYAAPKSIASTSLLVWKGARFQEEIDEAEEKWKFNLDVVNARAMISEPSDADARVWLVIRGLQRR